MRDEKRSRWFMPWRWSRWTRAVVVPLMPVIYLLTASPVWYTLWQLERPMSELLRTPFATIGIVGIFLCLALGCVDSPPSGQPAFVMSFDTYSGTANEAIVEYSHEIEQGDPSGSYHAQRAAAWHSIGEYFRATSDYQEAIRIEEAESDRHLGFAHFLATCPDARFRDGERAVDEAILFFEIADRPWFNGKVGEYRNESIRAAVLAGQMSPEMKILFVKGWNWDAIETLAAAIAETGDFERAEKLQTAIIDSFTLENGERIGHLTEEGLAKMRSRLELYQRHQPLREEKRSSRFR